MPRRRRSLALRLTAWYAATSMLLMLATTSVLLSPYRRRVWMVYLADAAACAGIGYVVARRGFRPLKQVADAMRGVRPSTLHQRINAEELPAELGQLADGFNQMARELEDAFNRLGRCCSDIAHELRTPIHNLRGEAEVALGRARSPEEYRESLGSFLEECVRLSSLIDRLLFLARADDPQTQIRRARLAIALELSRLREFYAAPAAEAGLSLALDADGSVVADLDRQLFQQAVGNLVENAIAYSDAGGTITLGARAERQTLFVEVQDTGRGIPAEHLPRLCDRFYRVDGARSGKTGGLGLGLAIVKSIAALHGGSLRISSVPGVGTRVSLILPLVLSPADGAAARETTGAV
jgi:two-component system heavy metal sensor histidine kinase CusS